MTVGRVDSTCRHDGRRGDIGNAFTTVRPVRTRTENVILARLGENGLRTDLAAIYPR